ncbi:MAG TPA: hypothetical protein VMO47_18870 [Rhodothermales bacterium]|nr:hypothetical protein [Rhodothermales bacterium]
MRTVLVFLLVFSAVDSKAQQPDLPADDRIRLAEAFALARDIQDRVWAGWSDAPFAVLVVTPDQEFLIRHPRPSDNFAPAGYDSLLQSNVYVRPRGFATNLLATFPAVGGVPTVVIGQPENTGRSSTAWVLTVLHEHFHQLQTAQPDYYDAVAALELSGGDETGMWMLDYSFPYDSGTVIERFAVYRDALLQALDSLDSPVSQETYDRVVTARSDLRNQLADADYRYLSFQLWQEGVARYIEHRVAETAASHHSPLPAFEALPDFMSYGAAADSIRAALLDELENLDLAAEKRLAFYATGAAEALLLDALRPDWKSRYLRNKFQIDSL